MKNVKLIFIFFLLIVISACSLSFHPTSDRKLHNKYKYSEKSEDFLIFYNVKLVKNAKKVTISFKNNSNFFMSNFAIRVTYPNSNGSDYFSLGNIKNSNSKSISINIPKEINSLTLSYEYYLSREDAFLKSESYSGDVSNSNMYSEEYKKTGSKIIFLK